MKKRYTISLLLKSEVGNINLVNVPGTEQIFIDDIHLLSKYFSVRPYARFTYHRSDTHIYKIYYPIFLYRVSFLFRQFRFFRWISYMIMFCADIIYVLHFLIKNRSSDLYIGYSIPLLALLFPRKTIIIMENEQNFYGYRWLRRRYDQAVLLFCSYFLRNQTIINYHSSDIKNYHVLYNAIDKRIFNPHHTISIKQQPILRIAYCSAWVKEKGLDLVLDACLSLPKDIKKSVRLTIASNPHLWYSDKTERREIYQNEMYEKISNLKNVSLLGGVSHLGMPEVYFSHHLVIVPSVWEEPFGMVVLESLSCGTRVIVSNVGGIHEIVDEKNSILIKDINASKIRDCIVKLYTSKRYLTYSSDASLLTTKNKEMDKDYRDKKLLSYIHQRLLVVNPRQIN